MLNRDQIEGCVISAITQVFKNKDEEPPQLSPETLTDSSFGLDSIDWAEVVIDLEEKLGFDPFEALSSESIQLDSLHDWIELYVSMSAESP